MTESYLSALSPEIQEQVLSYIDYQSLAAAREVELLADAATSPSVLANIFRSTHPPAALTQRESRRLGMALAGIECAPVSLPTHTASQLTHSQELAALNDSITSLRFDKQWFGDHTDVLMAVVFASGAGFLLSGLSMWPLNIELLGPDCFQLLSSARMRRLIQFRNSSLFACSTGFIISAFASASCFYQSEVRIPNQLAEAAAQKDQLNERIHRIQDFWTLHDQLDPQTVVSEGYWTPEEAIQYELLHILLQLYPDLNDPGNDNRLIAFNLLMDWAQYVHAQRNNEIPRGAAFQGFDAWCVRNQNRRYVLHGTDSLQSLRQYSYRQNRWRRDFSQQELFLRRDAHPTPFDPEDRTHLEWLVDVLTAG